MATVVFMDLLNGNSGNLNLSKGWTFDRQATVSGVTGDAHEKVINAANADGMPKTGDPHPNFHGVILQDINCLSVSADIVKLVLKYRAPDGLVPTADDVVVRVGSSLSQVETNVDRNGNVLFTTYTYPSDYELRPELRSKTIKQPAIVQKLIPVPDLTLTRLEDESPLVLSSIYVGAVNSVPFQGGAARTWMCTNIDGISQDGGEKWNVTYSFQHRRDTWDKTIVFEDPQTSHPPVFDTPAATALGIKTYQIYQLIDFNALAL